MAQRKKPDACCPVIRVRPLSAASRDRLTSMLKALSNPTRLEILRAIAAQPGPVCACDVVDRFDLSQPTISHHLKVLADAGLVTREQRGKWAWYRVAGQELDALADFLGSDTA